MADQDVIDDPRFAEYAVPDAYARAAILPESYKDEAALYASFAWLRANQPLGFARLPAYDPVWLVTKHADVMAIERQPELFHNMDDNPILNTQPNDAFLRDINGGTTRAVAALTHMDNPEHRLYRNIAANYFLPGKIGRLEGDIRILAREAVDMLLAGPKTVDFMKDFALHYPLRVIMTMFGVPREDEPQMLRLTQEFFGFNDPEEKRDDVEITPDMAARQFQQTLQDYYAYFDSFTKDRRASPRDDLMSLIANYKVDGEFIPDFFVNGYYVTIATAGHDTTSSSAGMAMMALINFPGQLARVKADPSLIPGLIDEAIRWATPVRHFMRTATADTEIRGRPIRKGDRLMLCYPSANRDEEVFENPNAFDVTRKPNRHIAFGFGPHICLGQHLAKLELRILFEELLPHIDAVSLAGTPRFVETNFVGGLKSLPVTFSMTR